MRQDKTITQETLMELEEELFDLEVKLILKEGNEAEIKKRIEEIKEVLVY